MSSSANSEDLFFHRVVQSYVDKNPRFLRRDWLAKQLDEKLREPGKRFVLLTAEPGAGKSTFVAQLAHDHPEWLRYFIRRDQRSVLSDVSGKSLLLRIGYQLAALHPKLFSQEQLHVSVSQRVGRVADTGEAVGAEIARLTASPFYQKILEIEQDVRSNQGRVIGLRVSELVIETRLLSAEDLLYLALIDPARAFARMDPGKQLVILVDALDEIRYHQTAENILTWLANCPALPENIRFVLTSRPPDDRLNLFRAKQTELLAELSIAEDDVYVKQDVEHFVTALVREPPVAQVLSSEEDGAEAFAKKVTGKANGNLGYLDALARGIDQVSERRDTGTIDALLSLNKLPADLEGLYAFFLRQLKDQVDKHQIVGKDSDGKMYSTDVWPAVYEPILGALAVAAEPVSAELIARLGGIAVDFKWVHPALNRLRQFLDEVGGCYRFYHATLTDFLTSEKTRTNPAIADLYQDAKQLHQQIADYYWSKHRDDWSNCDNYGLTYLARHISEAKECEWIAELITERWIHARVTHDAFQYDELFSDLSLLWDRSKEQALLDVRKSIIGKGFISCVQIALVRSNAQALSGRFAPALVTQAIKLKVWSIEKALFEISLYRDPIVRAGLLLGLLKNRVDELPKALRSKVLAQARNISMNIPDRAMREQMIEELEPFITNDIVTENASPLVERYHTTSQMPTEVLLDGQRAELQKVRDMDVNDIDLDIYLRGYNAVRSAERQLDEIRSETIVALTPHLHPLLVADALSLASQIKDMEAKSAALSALAPCLGTQELVTVLKPHAFRDVRVLATALNCLAARLPETTKAKAIAIAITAALEIEDPVERACSLTMSATLLEGAEKEAVLEKALDTAPLFGFEQVVWMMSGELKGRLLDKALSKANEIHATCDDAYSYHYAMAGLLHKDEPESAAFHFYNSTTNDDYAFIEQAEYVAGALAKEKLEELTHQVLAIRCDNLRSDGLIALAPWLKGEVLTEALEAARKLNEDRRYTTLVALAANLQKDERDILVLEILSWVRTCPSKSDRSHLVVQLADKVSERTLGEAFELATKLECKRMRVEALSILARHMPPAENKRALSMAIEVIEGMEKRSDRVAAINDIYDISDHDAWVVGEARRCLVEDVLALGEQGTRDELITLLASHYFTKAPFCSSTVLEAIATAIYEITTIWAWPSLNERNG